MPSGSVTLVKLVQFLKVISYMVVIPLGMAMLLNDEQPKNANELIHLTVAGRLILVSP